eukprot:9482725-Pyramimonas_sp.AAC.1
MKGLTEGPHQEPLDHHCVFALPSLLPGPVHQPHFNLEAFVLRALVGRDRLKWRKGKGNYGQVKAHKGLNIDYTL